MIADICKFHISFHHSNKFVYLNILRILQIIFLNVFGSSQKHTITENIQQNCFVYKKFAKPWFDSRFGSASLCLRKTLKPHFPAWGPSSLSVVVAQPDKIYAIRNVLCWSDKKDTKHYTKEEVG